MPSFIDFLQKSRRDLFKANSPALAQHPQQNNNVNNNKQLTQSNLDKLASESKNEVIRNPKSYIRTLPIYSTSTIKSGQIIRFRVGWMDPEELKRLSVREITDPGLYEKGVPKNDGLYSLYMGPISHDYKCSTCNGDVDNCQGHFGHANLPIPLYHPGAMNECFYLLQSTCSCGRSLIQPDHPKYKELINIRDPRERLSKVSKIASKIEYCGGPPSSSEDLNLAKGAKSTDRSNSIGCHARQPIWAIHKTEILCGQREFKIVKERKSKKATTAKKSSSSTKKGGRNRNRKCKDSDDEDDSDANADDSNEDLSDVDVDDADDQEGDDVDVDDVDVDDDQEGDDADIDADADCDVDADDATLIKDPYEAIGVDDEPQIVEVEESTVRSRLTAEQQEKEKNNITRILIKRKGTGLRYAFTSAHAKQRFKRISDADCKLLGFDREAGACPENMLVSVLPISPPATRISAIGGDTRSRSESDLTKHLAIILKDARSLKEIIAELKPDVDYLLNRGVLDGLAKLQKSYFNYISSDVPGVTKAKIFGTGSVLKSLTHKWNGKRGRARGELTNKRGDHNGRSTISPSGNKDSNRVGIGKVMAKKLTVTETVTHQNIDGLRQAVVRGPDVYPGALTIIKKNGEMLDLRYVKNRRAMDLQIGMKVERHLINGDVVLIGRQPSLHKMSLMAQLVYIHDGYTIELHLANCTPYNADFDGDEMNMYVPQTEQARAEALHLMMTNSQITDPQDKACMGLGQDGLVSCHLITSCDIFHTREQVLNFVASMDYWNGFELPNAGLSKPAVLLPKRGQSLWTGKQCASFTLPINQDPKQIQSVNYSRAVNSLEDILNDKAILICSSQILLGRLNKSIMGPSRGGLVQNICHDFGHEICGQFISDASRFFNNWISYYGFSISVADCPRDHHKQVEHVTQNSIEYLKKFSHENAAIEEAVIRQNLDSHRNAVSNLAMVKIPGKDNRYLQIIESGAKGSIANFCQTNVQLGQQYVEDNRIEQPYNGRSLPHFFDGDKSPCARGYVAESFMKGLKPTSTYWHAMGGREGLVKTATTTASIGRLNRIKMRAMEDVVYELDGTLRDGKQIVGFSYGGNNFSPCWVETQYYPCDSLDLDKMMDTLLLDDEEEFLQLVKDVKLMRQIKLSFDDRKIDSSVKSPVAFERILKGVNNSSSGVIVDPKYVVQQVAKMLEYCRKQTRNPQGLFTFEALARYYLCSKNIVVNYQLDKRAFDRVIIMVKQKFHKALIQAGERVGGIAGQSIGEPCQQMTLNSFHSAGIGGQTLTACLPKMIEIVLASRKTNKVKNSSMFLPLDSNHQDRESAKRIVKLIKPVALNKLVMEKECQVLWDPSLVNTLIIEDKEMIQDALIFIPREQLLKLGCLAIRLVLDKTKCLNHGLEITDIVAKLKRTLAREHLWIYSNTNADKWVILLRLMNENKDYVKFSKRKTNKRSIIHKLASLDPASVNVAAIASEKINKRDATHRIKKMLLSTIVVGIKNIVSCNIFEDDRIEYDPATLKRVVKKELFLRTRGTNLSEVMSIPGLDHSRITTNNILEIERVAGIEGTNDAIIQIVKDLFNQNGSYVNEAHFYTLAAMLTKQGIVIGFGKNGYHKNPDLGFLKRIVFEQIYKTIMRASMGGDADNMHNITSEIIIGRVPKIGTNRSSILARGSAFEEARPIINKNNELLKSRLMKDLEPEDMIRMIPTLYSDPRYMNALGNGYNGGGICNDYHYESYLEQIRLKNCRRITPDYSHLLNKPSHNNGYNNPASYGNSYGSNLNNNNSSRIKLTNDKDFKALNHTMLPFGRGILDLNLLTPSTPLCLTSSLVNNLEVKPSVKIAPSFVNIFDELFAQDLKQAAQQFHFYAPGIFKPTQLVNKAMTKFLTDKSKQATNNKKSNSNNGNININNDVKNPGNGASDNKKPKEKKGILKKNKSSSNNNKRIKYSDEEQVKEPVKEQFKTSKLCIGNIITSIYNQ